MSSWQNASGKENHKSLFDNVSHDRCIFCGSDRTEIARTDFVLMFSEFEYSKGSICKSCYHANANKLSLSRRPGYLGNNFNISVGMIK